VIPVTERDLFSSYRGLQLQPPRHVLDTPLQEATMKKTIAIAALLMASTAAHAGNGITFQIDGKQIQIDAPRKCASLNCVKISAPGFNGSLGNINLKGLGSSKDDDDDVASTPVPAPAPVQATAPPPAPPPASNIATAPVAATSAGAPSANVTSTASTPAAAAAPGSTSPIGVWATEEDKGNVRIEQCGANLCGYSVKSGERILINMQADGAKWTGRIHDPDSGRNYDSSIAMKGPNALRVQGCAFGGMFCGGKTWKRVS